MSLQFNIPSPAQKQNVRTLSKGFGLPIVQRALIAANNFNIKTDTPDGISLYGTPMYGTLFIQRPEYTTFEFNDFTNKYVETPNPLASNKSFGTLNVAPGINTEGAQGLFLNGVIIDATVNKTIVKTEVIDLKGTVKEYLGESDLTITIRGYVATQNPDEYPDDDARLIKSYSSAPVSLKVTSDFLNNILGVSQIVIESCQMSQQQGLRNVQYFQLNCVSDIDYTISKTTKDV
jgi:hypothetical protein